MPDLHTLRKSANTTDSLRTAREHHRPPSNNVWPPYTAERRSNPPTTHFESIVWSTTLCVVQGLRAHRNVRPRYAVPAVRNSGKSVTSLKHVTQDSHRDIPGFHRACGHSVPVSWHIAVGNCRDILGFRRARGHCLPVSWHTHVGKPRWSLT